MGKPATTTSYPMDWAPYIGAGEAAAHLIPFTNATLGHNTGIIWADGQACTVLRQPLLDSDGFGNTLVASWVRTFQPPPAKPHGVLERIETFFEGAIASYGEAQINEAQANLAASETILKFLSSKPGEHVTGAAFDLLGLVAFAMLFVPVAGEVEMGAMAALAAAAPYTGVIAGAGGLMGSWVDGEYIL